MPTTIVSGFIIRCVKISATKRGEVTKVLSLDRKRQWRVKPIEEAYVHTAETVLAIWSDGKVNGRRPDTITPANYDGRDTIPTGQPENFRDWCGENLQPATTQ